ncbi:MAG TPA: hypothetical protein VGL65_03350 [Gemmatimonadales bacterium]|jgi:hypothetical protein
MTESPQELAAVEQLLAESDALQGWIQRVDQAPVAAPDAVRERVRRDYQERLDLLAAGLRAHADIIAARLDADRREHDELQGRGTAARDALAEAELRFAVGEYDRDRFDAERTRHGSDIETFDVGIAAAIERIGRLEDIQGMMLRGSRTRPVAPAFEPANHPAAEPEAAAPDAKPAPAELDVQAEVEVVDLAPDEDHDLLAVFDEPGEVVDDTTAPSASQEFGPLSFRPPGAEPSRTTPSGARARSFDSAAPLGIPAADVPPRFVRPGERVPGPAAITVPPVVEASSQPASELFADEIVVSGPAPEVNAVPVGRTLRCGECGAMNRPLEWYCEKCGAELAAV